MADWNGVDPIEAGMRLSFRRGGFFERKAIVLFISDSFIVGEREESGEQFGFPVNGNEQYSQIVTDRQLAIEDMAGITGKSAPQFLRYFGMIYDAGYRKP